MVRHVFGGQWFVTGNTKKNVSSYKIFAKGQLQDKCDVLFERDIHSSHNESMNLTFIFHTVVICFS